MQRLTQTIPTSVSCASVTDTFGQIQVATHSGQIVIDLQGRHYGADAQLYRDHGFARLSVAQARRVRDMLDQAIEAALDGSAQQPGLWSPATLAAVAGRFGRRAA